MFEKEAEESFMCKKVLYKWETDKRSYIGGFSDGAEFGYNKAKEEMQAQDYSLGDFAIKYEDGKYKCKDKSGREFESVDGKPGKKSYLQRSKHDKDND